MADKELAVKRGATATKKKPRGRPFTGRDDPRANKKGAPKRGESWAEIIKRVGEYTPSEAAERSLSLAKQLLEIGDGMTLKEAVIMRIYASLLFEPQPGLFNAFMDRTEGKVTQPIEVNDLRDKADSELISEFQSIVDSARTRAVGSDSGGTETTPSK